MTHFHPSLVNEFVYATECQLATLSGLLIKKGTAKSEIKRQIAISLRMLNVCKSEKTNIDWGTQWHPNFGRVQEIVNMSEAIDVGFELWVRRVHGSDRPEAT
jgi:hypothetical protein